MVKNENAAFPDKKYRVIYADPPWTYRDKAHAGKRGAGHKYDLMTKRDLENLPVSNLRSDEGTVLLMWATMPKLDEAFDLIKAWGFDYKTCAFTWVKRNKVSPTWFWGMGRWTRANAELCLLATYRGGAIRMSAGVHSVIDTPIERHSQKPAIVRDRIVELLGDIPRIELFARQTADGWDSWGNEIEIVIDDEGEAA